RPRYRVKADPLRGLAATHAVTADDLGFEGNLGLLVRRAASSPAVAWTPPTDFTCVHAPPTGSPLHSSGHYPHDWLLGPTASPMLPASATVAPLASVRGTDAPRIPIAHSEALAAADWRAGPNDHPAKYIVPVRNDPAHDGFRSELVTCRHAVRTPA
ncbi:hypothetical protein, partial [Amycolatopsis saalfeldensis]